MLGAIYLQVLYLFWGSVSTCVIPGNCLVGILKGWCPQGPNNCLERWYLNILGRVSLNKPTTPPPLPDQERPRNASQSTDFYLETQCSSAAPRHTNPSIKPEPGQGPHSAFQQSTPAQTAGVCSLILQNTCAHVCPSAHIPMCILTYTPRPAHQQMTQPHRVTTSPLTSHTQVQTLICTPP